MDKVWIEKLAIQELCSRYCQTIDAKRIAVIKRTFAWDLYTYCLGVK